MKKFIALLITILLVFSIVTCGKKNSVDAPKLPNINVEKILSDSDAPKDYGSALYVKINPEFVFFIADDGSQNVIGYKALNDDAKKLEKLCKFSGRSIYDAITELVHVASDEGYLKNDGDVVLHVIAGNDEEEVQNLFSHAEKAVNDAAKELGANYNAVMTIEPVVEKAINPDGNSDSKNGKDNSNPGKQKEEDNCHVCQGTGKCSLCEGTGRETCRCNGTGIESCGQCSGTGSHPCNVCGTSGLERCSICGGNGIDERDGNKTCTTCNGTGIRTCPGCGGSGYAFCGQCSGTGQATCNQCGGKGYEICGTTGHSANGGCNGTGICQQCGGTGKEK